LIELKKHLKPLFEDESRHQTIVAHRRFGKTSFAIWKSIFSALKKKDSRYFVVMPTYKQAKMVAWKMLASYLKLTGCQVDMKDGELRAEFPNGSEIALKGSDYPDSLRGVGLDGCVMDEYAMQSPSVYSEIIRPALADKHGWSIKISTPKGKNHFYSDYMNSEHKHYYPASQTDIIDKAELEAAKSEMSPEEYNQEFECEFLYYAGQVYKSFDERKHIIDGIDIVPAWKRMISIDFGMTNPTAILFGASDYDGNLYIYDEIYDSGKDVMYYTDAIKAKLSEGYQAFIDPSTLARDRFRDGVRYSIFQEFIDNGIPILPANNQVLGGINAVNQLFLQDRIKIFKKCENLIRELNTYHWKEKKAIDSNNPEEPAKVNDHAVDALRYMCATSELPITARPKTLKDYAQDRLNRLMKVGKHKEHDWYED
jgi:phage terminase large subunit